MAHPKSKRSVRGRKMRERANTLTKKVLTTCAQCGATRRPHHACEKCGMYRGRTVASNK
jgi:large subunit ribosomal protein L32